METLIQVCLLFLYLECLIPQNLRVSSPDERMDMVLLYIIITLPVSYVAVFCVIASSCQIWQKIIVAWPSTFVVEFPSQNFKNY